MRKWRGGPLQPPTGTDEEGFVRSKRGLLGEEGPWPTSVRETTPDSKSYTPSAIPSQVKGCGVSGFLLRHPAHPIVWEDNLIGVRIIRRAKASPVGTEIDLGAL